MSSKPVSFEEVGSRGCLYPVFVGDLRLVCGGAVVGDGSAFCRHHQKRVDTQAPVTTMQLPGSVTADGVPITRKRP